MPFLPVPQTIDFHARAVALVQKMTLSEKVSQMVNDARAIPRLGIPAYNWWSEGLHGVAFNGVATVFPQAIGRAASFDVPLEHTIGGIISTEARAKYEVAIRSGSTRIFQGLTFWSPNINIFRDPRWGRGQETFGEDPLLTSRMGVAFVTGMQGDDPNYFKVVATPKHFAVHSGPDPLRHQFDVSPSKQDLWSTYLPAFQACVTEGHAYSVMSAYNSVYGTPCSANTLLLGDILRKQWGFQGYVVSDCGAIDDIYQRHHYVATAAEASAAAVKAGCDVECGGSYGSLQEAVAKGLIDEATIDKSVTRLMEARYRLGILGTDPRCPYSNVPTSIVDSPKFRAVALQSARESLVLLKNQGSMLPLHGKKRIAVIGPNADDPNVLLGNYNGTPSKSWTPFAGIRAGAPAGSIVSYAKGCGVTGIEEMSTDVPVGNLRAEYFANPDLGGTPVIARSEPKLNHDWGNDGPRADMKDHFSARWTGDLTAPESGDYKLGVRADDGVRLIVDGKTLVDDWSEHAARLSSGTIRLVKGQTVHLKVEYYEKEGQASIQLQWSRPTSRPYEEAVALAKRSDVVIACLGINAQVENEENDRKDIVLPAAQEGLLKALVATGKPVALVYLNGGPVSSVWAQDHVPAIIEAWYPGEEGGTAIADALFGRYNPSGRLPVTVYRGLSQVPDFADYVMNHDRTYRYFKGQPLYPFGYGLSYTRFSYSGLRVAKKSGPLEVSVRVRNVGKRTGDEVVQLYWTRSMAAPTGGTGLYPLAGAPIRELKVFTRVHLKAGESKRVTLAVPERELDFIDVFGERTRPKQHLDIWVGGGQPGSSTGVKASIRP